MDELLVGHWYIWRGILSSYKLYVLDKLNEIEYQMFVCNMDDTPFTIFRMLNDGSHTPCEPVKSVVYLRSLNVAVTPTAIFKQSLAGFFRRA